MKYIDLINTFWDSAMINPLSSGQIALYFALLNLCNKNYWSEWFPASSQLLCVLTGLSKSGVLKARKELQERGLLDWKQQGTRATSYKLTNHSQKHIEQDKIQVGIIVTDQTGVQESNRTNVLSVQENQNSKRKSNQVSIQESSQVRKQESNQVSVQESNRICAQESSQISKREHSQTSIQTAENKRDCRQKNDPADIVLAESNQVSSRKSNRIGVRESNQISERESSQASVQALYSINNIKDYKDIRQKTETPPISPLQRVEEFLSAYPTDYCNRYLTEREYATLMMTGKITESDLVSCAQNYAETCRIEERPQRYIKNAENFLREFVFEQYLPERYHKPAKTASATLVTTAEAKSKNRFNDFPQRDYNSSDINALERQLLGV